MFGSAQCHVIDGKIEYVLEFALLVCATQRSGSTLLCELLEGHGRRRPSRTSTSSTLKDTGLRATSRASTSPGSTTRSSLALLPPLDPRYRRRRRSTSTAVRRAGTTPERRLRAPRSCGATLDDLWRAARRAHARGRRSGRCATCRSSRGATRSRRRSRCGRAIQTQAWRAGDATPTPSRSISARGDRATSCDWLTRGERAWTRAGSRERDPAARGRLRGLRRDPGADDLPMLGHRACRALARAAACSRQSDARSPEWVDALPRRRRA